MSMFVEKRWVIFFLVIALFTFTIIKVDAGARCTGSGGSCLNTNYCNSLPSCFTYLLPNGDEVCAGGTYSCDSISDKTLCEAVSCTWEDTGGGGGGREMCPADRCIVDTILIDFPVIGSAERDYAYGSCSSSARSSEYCNLVSHDECSTFSCGGIDHVCTFNHKFHAAAGWYWYNPNELRETDFCSDGLDNDCDGDTDEDDSDCGGSDDYCELRGVTTDITGCSGGVCKSGDRVIIRGSVSGNGCTSATRFQVNFIGDDCEVSYQGGDLSGVHGIPSIVGSGVSATWTVPVVIGTQCEGETVTAQAAELWDGAPLMLSRTTDVRGTITFEGTASYTPCSSASGWKTKDTTHAYCTNNLVGCVRDREGEFSPLTLGLYDQYCDTDNTIKNIQIGYVGGEF